MLSTPVEKESKLSKGDFPREVDVSYPQVVGNIMYALGFSRQQISKFIHEQLLVNNKKNTWVFKGNKDLKVNFQALKVTA